MSETRGLSDSLYTKATDAATYGGSRRAERRNAKWNEEGHIASNKVTFR